VLGVSCDCVVRAAKSMKIVGSIIRYLPAIGIAVQFAKWMGDALNQGLYHQLIHLKAMDLLESVPRGKTKGAVVRDIMVPNVMTLSQEGRCGDLREMLDNCTHNGFPVVEEVDGKPMLRGLVLRKYGTHASAVFLCVLSQERRACGSAADVLRCGRGTHTFHRYLAPRVVAEIPDNQMIDVALLMNRTPYKCEDEDVAFQSLNMFRLLGIRHMVVVSKVDSSVVGILTRKDFHSLMEWDKHGGHGHGHDSHAITTTTHNAAHGSPDESLTSTEPLSTEA
jgi:chloride channel 7